MINRSSFGLWGNTIPIGVVFIGGVVFVSRSPGNVAPQNDRADTKPLTDWVTIILWRSSAYNCSFGYNTAVSQYAEHAP